MAGEAEKDVKTGDAPANSSDAEALETSLNDESNPEVKKLAEELGKDEKSEPSSEDVKADGDEKKHENAVPYERFKQVNDKVKTLEQELEQLKQQVAKPQQTESKEKTWEDLNVDELEKVIDYYAEQGDHKMVAKANKYLAKRVASEQVSEFKTSVDQDRDFSKVRVETWTAAVKEYPDLAKPTSEHYKLTEALVKSDPRFNQVPDGHALAAKIVAAQLLTAENTKLKAEHNALKQRILKAGKKDALEGGGRSVATGGSSLEQLEKAAIDSKNPFSPETKAYLKALDSTKPR